jgi:hypothetical protein
MPTAPHQEDPVPQTLIALLVHVQARLLTGGDRDRGDVPGWVLITLMTAGLVTVLWKLAGPQLSDILTNSLNDVKGPGN